MLDSGELEREADDVRLDLNLDGVLGALGEVHLVGSAALGVMVWRDLDLTVVCPTLDVVSLYRAGSSMIGHPRVRQMRVRNDTGPWNGDTRYPDGVYWGIDYRHGDQQWNIDVWFVDQPERQPDLALVRDLRDKFTGEARSAILTIKRAWFRRPEYGRQVSSYDIYTAVLEHDVRSLQGFDAYLASRPPLT